MFEYNPENLERGKGWNIVLMVLKVRSFLPKLCGNQIWVLPNYRGNIVSVPYYSTADAPEILHAEQTSHKQGGWIVAKQQLTTHHGDKNRWLNRDFVNVTVHDSDTNNMA